MRSARIHVVSTPAAIDANASPNARRPAHRVWKLYVAMLALVGLVCLLLGEFMVRFFAPQPSWYPRNSFSAEYGFLPYASEAIIHEKPGRWRFEYNTNRFGHRIPEVGISNVYPVPNIVVLGDSWTFGFGVNDGEEYSSIMRASLAGRAQVVNLGVGGWGLTQEIRRFYEFGQLYQPKVVVLAYCANDPSDNISNRVTDIRDGQFVFQPTENRLQGIKKYLSHSLIQKSQLYNLLRAALYDRLIEDEVAAAMHNKAANEGEASEAERLHIRLLEAFARDLQQRGTELIMIAINNQLPHFPFIERKVHDFDNAGLLRYVEIMDGIAENAVDYSPEGHWGPSTHRAIGEHLATIIERSYLTRN